MSLELSGQDWSFIEESFAEPSIPTEDGADQSIQDHLVQSGQDWSFHIDPETNSWVRMFGERFIEDEYKQKVKQPLRDGGLTAPSRGEIKVRVRKRG